MNFVPKDQIVLLAGLETEAVRGRIWAFPELGPSLRRLENAGLLENPAGNGSGPSRLSNPAGMAAAGRLRHITLSDLMAEHLPERA